MRTTPQQVGHKIVAMATPVASNGATKSALYGRIVQKHKVYKLQNRHIYLARVPGHVTQFCGKQVKCHAHNVYR